MPTRRDLLRTCAAAGIAAGAGAADIHPLLRPLHARLMGEAGGKAPRARRFVFIVQGNGLPPSHIQPAGIELPARGRRAAFAEHALKGAELTRAMQPIAAWKDRVTILQGLSGMVCNNGHSAQIGTLGAFAARGSPGNSGIAVSETVDAAIAKAHPGIIPIVNLGIGPDPNSPIVFNATVWNPGQKLPTILRPDLAYATLFGSVAGGEAAAAFKAQSSLLDFLADDVRRLRARIAPADTARLDEYLAAYEELGNRQRRLVEVRDRLAGAAPICDDKYRSAVETDRLDAQFELAGAALIGGLTNVVTIASGMGEPWAWITYKGLGVGIDLHQVGHGIAFADMSSDEIQTRIRTLHFQLLARLMTRLQAVREGDGTMLDNTVIVYLSDAAEAHHPTSVEWPAVIVGDLGGRLRRGGRCLIYPDHGKRGHRTINNLYMSLLHAAGVPRDEFGQKDAGLRDLDQSGPLAELLA